MMQRVDMTELMRQYTSEFPFIFSESRQATADIDLATAGQGGHALTITKQVRRSRGVARFRRIGGDILRLFTGCLSKD